MADWKSATTKKEVKEIKSQFLKEIVQFNRDLVGAKFVVLGREIYKLIQFQKLRLQILESKEDDPVDVSVIETAGIWNDIKKAIASDFDVSLFVRAVYELVTKLGYSEDQVKDQLKNLFMLDGKEALIFSEADVEKLVRVCNTLDFIIEACVFDASAPDEKLDQAIAMRGFIDALLKKGCQGEIKYENTVGQDPDNNGPCSMYGQVLDYFGYDAMDLTPEGKGFYQPMLVRSDDEYEEVYFDDDQFTFLGETEIIKDNEFVKLFKQSIQQNKDALSFSNIPADVFCKKLDECGIIGVMMQPRTVGKTVRSILSDGRTAQDVVTQEIRDIVVAFGDNSYGRISADNGVAFLSITKIFDIVDDNPRDLVGYRVHLLHPSIAKTLFDIMSQVSVRDDEENVFNPAANRFKPAAKKTV